MAAEPTQLVVDTVRSGDDVLLALTGEIDLATADPMVDQVTAHLKPGPGILTLDLAGVTFCDSSGLRAFVIIHQACERAGWKYVLTGLTEPVHRVFDLSGVLKYLHIQDTTPSP